MRYRLRTLLIVLGLGPPVLAAMFWEAMAFGWDMFPVYAAALAISGTALALTLWFL